MKTAIETITRNRCTGCYACVSSCPTHALSMSLDEDGFLVPIVNSSKCTKCGLCKQNCPILNSQYENDLNPVSFAAWTDEKQVQLKSSSGGIFSELAKSIIKKGGAVFGAAFDENFNVRHCRIENDKDLVTLRGSKYVQSRINDAYLEAISIALKNRPILFSGTPCQIAALNNLGKSKIDKTLEFYSCEVICHGTPSESIFRSYLNNISNNRISDMTEFSFRDKKVSWGNFGSRASFLDGSEYFKPHGEDPFMIGYLKNIYLKPICYDCPFAKMPRKADITLGDFWGVPRKHYNPLGVSAVIINSRRGRQLFDTITDVHKVPVSIGQIARKNIRLVNGHLEKPSERSDFFKYFRSNGFQEASEKYLKSSSLKDNKYVYRLSSILRLR